MSTQLDTYGSNQLFSYHFRLVGLVLQEAQKEVRHENFYTVHRRDKSTMKVCRCALRMMKLPCKAAKSTVHSVEEETFNVH